jgi:hypothetical protein
MITHIIIIIIIIIYVLCFDHASLERPVPICVNRRATRDPRDFDSSAVPARRQSLYRLRHPGKLIGAHAFVKLRWIRTNLTIIRIIYIFIHFHILTNVVLTTNLSV